MAYIDKVVDVTVTLGTSTVETETFETPLFVAIHNVFPERYRSYADLDSMVTDGFAVGSPAHSWAANVFQGAFAPELVTIGRQNWTGTSITLTGFTNTADLIFSVTAGGFTKSVTAAYTANDTATQLATKVAAALNDDDDLTTVLTAAANAGVVSVTAKNNSKVSIGGYQGTYIISNTSSETVGVALPLIHAAVEDWYFLCTESHTAADVQAAAEYAKAVYKLHVYSTEDPNTQIAADTTNIAAILKDLSMDSVGMYHQLANSDFPEGGIVGAMASRDPSYGDSLHLKILPGVATTQLSAGARAAIWGHNCNFYRSYAGQGAFCEGLTASGQYEDLIRFAHWCQSKTDESVLAYLRKRSNLGYSMKMSDEDLPVLKSIIMNSPINIGITNGSILTGFDTDNQVFYDPVITIPKRAKISSTDLANRVLNNVKVELIYNNALHFVKINIYVLLDAADLSTNAVTA